jgi:hypothetical protein
MTKFRWLSSKTSLHLNTQFLHDFHANLFLTNNYLTMIVSEQTTNSVQCDGTSAVETRHGCFTKFKTPKAVAAGMQMSAGSWPGVKGDGFG